MTGQNYGGIAREPYQYEKHVGDKVQLMDEWKGLLWELQGQTANCGNCMDRQLTVGNVWTDS